VSTVLGSHLRGRVAGQMLALLAALTGLMQMLELLDVTTDVLDRNLGVTGVLHYALLRLPSELMLALPLAALLGAMSTFYAMARAREITALRSAGLSMGAVLRYVLPVPLLFAVAQLGLSQLIVPAAEASLKTWWDSTAPENGPANPRWVRTSAGAVLFDRNSPDGRRLQGLHIYERGDDGLLTVRTRARSARWVSGQWLLNEVEDLNIEQGAAVRRKTLQRFWKSNLRPEEVMQLDVAQPHLSSTNLVDVIGGERVGTQPRSYYQTVLFKSFTAPLTVFIMLLLAVPPATTMERGGGGGRLLLALALGLGFLLCDGILSAMGTSGRIPAWAAAAVAPALFAAIGLVQLRACEKI
jgi:lipopolysaccharide export system permease protein